MARPARGNYPCKVCPDVLASPGALGGHMSAHRRRGEVPTDAARIVPEHDGPELYCDARDGVLIETPAGLDPLWIPVITALVTILLGALLVLLFVVFA